jgi:hypothetical protein
MTSRVHSLEVVEGVSRVRMHRRTGSTEPYHSLPSPFGPLHTGTLRRQLVDLQRNTHRQWYPAFSLSICLTSSSLISMPSPGAVNSPIDPSLTSNTSALFRYVMRS